MNQDTEHLRLLSIFHYVCAGLIALFACIPIFHLVFGLFIWLRPDLFGPPQNQPPAWFGLFFVALAALFIVVGWTFAALLAWSGRCLSRRRCYTFCVVMAGVVCVFVPVGTVLGVFTIIVLVRPSVKTLFENPAQPPAYA